MLRGAQHWARRRKLFQRPGLGKVGNVSSPEGFTVSLRVEIGEQVTVELWASFGGRRCSVERARARRSELVTATPLRPSFRCERGEREGMDASTCSRVSPWRSSAPPGLTSGARDGIRAPNVADVLTPVGHVDGDGLHLELRCLSDRATLTMINSQTVVN